MKVMLILNNGEWEELNNVNDIFFDTPEALMPDMKGKILITDSKDSETKVFKKSRIKEIKITEL